jgi:cytochrome d ubiquinol oxidase subunit II
MDLNTFWFFLIGALFAGYVMLDGFDLGTGPLLLCARGDTDRRLMLNAIGPVWNGNEVWLVTAAGAAFAAFPDVFATVATGFYDLMMLLLVALIFRAVAIELRSQRPGRVWRTTWDAAFGLSSVLSSLMLGLVLGNVIWGVPLDAQRQFRGDILSLLHPYALMTSLTTLLLCIMHANVYLVLKTQGTLQKTLMTWTRLTVPSYLACFVATNVVTMLSCPHIADAVGRRPIVLGGILAGSLLIALNIVRELRKQQAGRAFICSCLTILSHLFLLGLAAYPVLLFSTPNHEHDLTIYNSASTPATLRFMMIVALIGIPVVISYTVTVYYVFRNKVTLTEESY